MCIYSINTQHMIQIYENFSQDRDREVWITVMGDGWVEDNWWNNFFSCFSLIYAHFLLYQSSVCVFRTEIRCVCVSVRVFLLHLAFINPNNIIIMTTYRRRWVEWSSEWKNYNFRSQYRWSEWSFDVGYVTFVLKGHTLIQECMFVWYP